MTPNTPDDWLVTVPPYDGEGVKIERFTITQEQATHDKIRALFNPQRSDRSLDPGEYTRLEVDGVLWMTDTPAERRDLYDVDSAMGLIPMGSILIVGMGIGVVVHRAILRGMETIDVVERDERVARAVAPHYEAMAKAHGATLRIHAADIHDWRVPKNSYWDIGFFDIWPTICVDDMPEVTRLRKRFHGRLGWFSAWAQDERIASARRVRNGTGFY